MEWFRIYFWVTYAVSVYCLMHIPTKMSKFDNFAGTLLASMFGFVLWPFFVAALLKTRRLNTSR